MPPFNDDSISKEFLLKLGKKEAHWFKRDQIQIAPSVKRSITAAELIIEIDTILDGNVKSGLSLEKPPSKEYLLNILYSLQKNHFCFNDEIRENESFIEMD